MVVTPEQLLAHLDCLGIEHSTVSHKPLFTVDDGRDIHAHIRGMHGKNLFIKDKKDQLWLIVMPGDKRADLGRLEKQLKASRFTFARPDILQDVLGLTPGSVTPFGLINDHQRRVKVVLDHDLMQSEWVHFHPLVNTASTSLRAIDLLKFITGQGYDAIVIDCGSGGAANPVATNI